MDAQQHNRELDAALKRTGVVDHELFLRLADAYSYDAASTVGWVEAKLRVLSQRLDGGGHLSLYDLNAKGQINVSTREQFDAWVLVHFPAVDV